MHRLPVGSPLSPQSAAAIELLMKLRFFWVDGIADSLLTLWWKHGSR